MSRRLLSVCLTSCLLVVAPALSGESKPTVDTKPVGDEIIVCGQRVHTGAPVVTWLDPGGYDAYKKDAPAKVDAGFGMRKSTVFTDAQKKKAQSGNIDLPTLQSMVDQFVIHYDVAGTSKRCFDVLHYNRGLAVQFMLDLDGTIYQTLDLKEGAWHATKANGRSVGIEIANMGAYAAGEENPFKTWYKTLPDGETIITVPGAAETNGIRNKSIVLKPSRPKPVTGMIQGKPRTQYDLTPQQYDSLIKLTAALHKTFPKIKLDYPHDRSGKLIRDVLPNDVYDHYEGVLGHYHVQTNKTDPGSAFQFDKVIEGAKALEAGK